MRYIERFWSWSSQVLLSLDAWKHVPTCTGLDPKQTSEEFIRAQVRNWGQQVHKVSQYNIKTVECSSARSFPWKSNRFFIVNPFCAKQANKFKHGWICMKIAVNIPSSQSRQLTCCEFIPYPVNGTYTSQRRRKKYQIPFHFTNALFFVTWIKWCKQEQQQKETIKTSHANEKTRQKSQEWFDCSCGGFVLG